MEYRAIDPAPVKMSVFRRHFASLLCFVVFIVVTSLRGESQSADKSENAPTLEQTVEYLNKIADSDPMPLAAPANMASLNGRFFVDKKRRMIWLSEIFNFAGDIRVRYYGAKVSDLSSCSVEEYGRRGDTPSGSIKLGRILFKCDDRCWQVWHVPQNDVQTARAYLLSNLRKPDDARYVGDDYGPGLSVPDDDKEDVVARFQRAWKHLFELVKALPTSNDPNDPFAK